MPDIFYISRILTLAAISFVIALAWTPILVRFLERKQFGKQIRNNGAPIFTKLHKKKEGTPTMGGILISKRTTKLQKQQLKYTLITDVSFLNHPHWVLS